MHPIRIGANRRYFADPAGNPVFWLGTTQWQLFREFTLDEARLIIEKSRATGFDFIQVMLLGVGDGTRPNLHGEKPCHNDDPETPNEAYFRNVDAVMEIARENDVAISMAVFHQRYRERITLEKARGWARWLAQRYGRFPNLVWSMTPRATQEFVPILRELAAGLKAGDSGAHLITFKPDPAPYSSSFIHNEAWLDFNCMQTWRGVELIYPMVTKDYHLSPTKPVVMAEGAYESGTEYGFDVTPLWVRRQAYYSYLAGASHTYGHNDSWRVLPTWKRALDAPGAAQLGMLKRIFLARDAPPRLPSPSAWTDFRARRRRSGSIRGPERRRPRAISPTPASRRSPLPTAGRMRCWSWRSRIRGRGRGWASAYQNHRAVLDPLQGGMLWTYD